MENRLDLFLLRILLLLSLSLPAAWAADEPMSVVVQPQLERPTSKPARIDSENFEVGIHTGIISIEDFETSSVKVARLAYHFSEDFFAEAAYGLAKAGTSSIERLGNIRLMSDKDRELRYYNIAFGFNLLPGEVYFGRDYTFFNTLYLIGGSGSTKFAGDERRTLNLGFGYRLLFNDWLAGHLDMRDHLFDSDALGHNKTMHNLETTLGLSVFF